MMSAHVVKINSFSFDSFKLLHANSQEKTAFDIHQALFEFKVMPFSVMNAPVVFQQLMQRAFSGLQFASVYLDDVIVYSEPLDVIN